MRLFIIMLVIYSSLPTNGADSSLLDSWHSVFIAHCDQRKGIITRVTTLKGKKLAIHEFQALFPDVVNSDYREYPADYLTCLVLRRTGRDGTTTTTYHWFDENNEVCLKGKRRISLEQLNSLEPTSKSTKNQSEGESRGTK